MGDNFLKFKRKRLVARVLKSVGAGAAVAMLLVGCWLHLQKLALIDIAPTPAYGIAAGAAVLVTVVIYLALHMSDRRLARALDERFALEEKVQTMVEFRKDSDGMVALQRADAEQSLANVVRRSFGMRGLWLVLLVLVLSAAMLCVGIFTEDKRNIEEPEVIVPFKVSEMQIAGIEELIRYVEDSAMESPYKEEIADALRVLLSDLRAAETEPQMQAALAIALTSIAKSTYNASSMVEIVDAMWSTNNDQIRALALSLNTERWTEPDWGDFAEKYEVFRLALHPADGEQITAEAQRWVLESFCMKLEGALKSSEVTSADILHAALWQLLHGDAADGVGGLAAIAQGDGDVDANVAAIDAYLLQMSKTLYGVISVQITNTNVGEYVLKKLATMFGMPIPAFERPKLVENEDDGSEDDRENNGSGGGGVGEGVTFGSDDLVLNPLTGEYVEYGTLYATYDRIKSEKLKNNRYTDAQKRAIEEYFSLLYSGLENEEGNE